MTAYSSSDEQRVRLQARVKAWTRSGLLDPEQGTRFLEQYRVGLRRTGPVLRGVLAGFTALVIAALVGLTFVVGDVDGDVGVAVLMGAYAALCLTAADHLVSTYRLYRHGVEEACAAAAIALSAFAAASAVSSLSDSRVVPVAAFGVAAGAGWFVYRRFGHLLAALASMACLAALPFQFSLPNPVERLVACGALALVGQRAALVRQRAGDDYPGDSAGVIRAAAWAGVYLLVNLWLTDGSSGSAARADAWRVFWWATFAGIWLIAVAALRTAVRQRDRVLLRVAMAMLLGSLASTKPYLGWPIRAWDPMLLGGLLMAGAVALRHWLSSGKGGERAGFTPRPIVVDDGAVMRAVGTVSVAVQPHAPVSPDTPGGTFDGGRSGGAGASGSF